MFDPNSTHHRCRNPRCKAWLKEPVEHPRDAFCCASCEVGFYRTHCRVCERALGETKRSARRQLCGKRKCVNEFRSDRKRAQLVSRYYPLAVTPKLTSKPEKNPTKSTPKTTIESDLGFAIGADYDREILRANFRVNAKFWNDAALIGLNDPPVNILGGYKFPAAPDIDLGAPRESPTLNRSSDSNPYLAQIPDDLQTPAFLRRFPDGRLGKVLVGNHRADSHGALGHHGQAGCDPCPKGLIRPPSNDQGPTVVDRIGGVVS